MNYIMGNNHSIPKHEIQPKIITYDTTFLKKSIKYFYIHHTSSHIIQFKYTTKLYLYVHKTHSHSNLIEIFYPSFPNFEKYIQLSPDFSLISIPDKEHLHIYNVNDLLTKHKLIEYHPSLNISHIIPHHPIKTTLSSTKFIHITPTIITIFNFDKAVPLTIRIPPPFTVFKTLLLTDHHNYITLSHTKSLIINTTTATITPTPHPISTTSDDNLLHAHITKTKTLALHYHSHTLSTPQSKFNFNFKSKLPILHITNFSSNYVISLWDPPSNLILWVFLTQSKQYQIIGPRTLTFHEAQTSTSLYTNNHIYIFENDAQMSIYDVHKYSALFFLDTILSQHTFDIPPSEDDDIHNTFLMWGSNSTTTTITKDISLSLLFETFTKIKKIAPPKITFTLNIS